MKHLQPYLMFDGDCEEALDFYARCLDGEIAMLQRFADSPLDVAAEHGSRVFNSVFRADEITFMASDNPPGEALEPGSNFAMFVTFSDPPEHARTFDALSRDGHVLMPPEDGFGMLRDRFGVQWMLALEEGA